MESKDNNEIILQESTTPTSEISLNDVISDGVDDDDEEDCNPSATNSVSPDNGKIDGMEERGATRSTSQPLQK